LLSIIEKSRTRVVKAHKLEQKTILGQYFTPANISRFMADLFYIKPGKGCSLLDAGAGMGSLSTAFLERLILGDLKIPTIELNAFEIVQGLLPGLNEVLKKYKEKLPIQYTIHSKDFIESAVNALLGNLFVKPLPKYTHAILNPPYRKIRSNSTYRNELRKVGIETVNLYSAFVALALSLLKKNGQLVAIIPRSFCNGPYFLPFRKYILEHAAIRQIHLFSSRNKAFKKDEVLQENVIIKLEREAPQTNVLISTSTDDSFQDYKFFIHPFNNIVSPSDANSFIRIPTSFDNTTSSYDALRHTLYDLGIEVSTGPVVDFRLKEYLFAMPTAGTVPLLYPGHFTNHTLEWPKPGFKKPNAIMYNAKTTKWLYPNGFYCIVRRFSAKEEKRRIIAGVVRPEHFKRTDMLGFENHLNVFHQGKKSLSEHLAHGLAAYLNSTNVDENFRLFNGHTQVNATDLRSLKYPSKEDLEKIGKWAIKQKNLTQELIDKKIKHLIP